MHTYWIVVANAGRASVYRKAQGLAGLEPVHQLDNPGGRAHVGEITEDQRGRIEKHGSGVMSAMDQAHDPHQQIVKDFAHEICRLLDMATNRHSYDELVLFAPAHFLGLLRAGLSAATKKLPISCLAKDLTQLALTDLENRLSDMLHFHPVGSASVND
jgi:protein required for attachment to host cells